jgi:glycosyltransferase involved in cell wall biosynthesis
VSPSQKIAVLADFPLHTLPQGRFPPPSGHYATWLPQLALGFEKAKEFEFHWITLDASLPKTTHTKAWHQNFHILPTWRKGRATTLFWADRRKIHKKLEEIEPDLVHGWGNENIWGWATLASGRPHIFSIQGLLGCYGKLGHQGLRDRLMTWIEAAVLRKAMVVTAESPWAIQQVQRQTGRKDIRHVEYGLPNEFFTAHHAPDRENPYALMVGTADFRKGIDFAVRLFLRPALAGIRLKIIGGLSPYGERCKKASSDNIEWLGRKTQKEVLRYMEGATCLLLPTRGDTGPTVAKEARVVGVPLVASPNGGHIQYIQHGQNGFICPLDEPEAWETSLQILFRDPARAGEMGAWQREAQREVLRPERTAEEFLRLYREILSFRK